MKKHPNIRLFYDNYYSGKPVINPAYEIYDALRVNTIRYLKGDQVGKFLIIGCGSRLDFQIPDHQDTPFAFDLSFEAIKRVVGMSPALFVGDARQIPLPSQVFDIAVCSEVLEHIPDIQQAINELERILKPGGTLIVSSPNWFSWFGISRWIGEKVTGKRLASNDQPYDDWKTIWRYRKVLEPAFKIVEYRGIWYFPPLHFREKGLSRKWTRLLYAIFAPIDNFFSKYFPFCGHLIIIKCTKTISK